MAPWPMRGSTENATLKWTAQCQLPALPLAVSIRASYSFPITRFHLEYVIIAFLRPLKIQCLYIAYTEISVLITLFCLQRKLSHASTQKNPCGAENKTGS